MCFSATASFTAAAVLTGTGTTSVKIARRRQLGEGVMLLASFPLLFGLQQFSEGIVWLGVYGITPAWMTAVGTALFVFAAYVMWPILGPLAGWLMEPNGPRKKIFAAFLAAGLAVGGYLAYAAVMHPQVPIQAHEWGGHLHYLNDFAYMPRIEILYFITASIPLLFSTNRTAVMFAVVLSAAFIATWLTYNVKVLPSVWCFYAAIGSAVVVLGLWIDERREAMA